MVPHTTEDYDELAEISINSIKERFSSREDKRVFALVSGGVDSAVALLLALRAGLDVIGVTMRNTDECSAISEAAGLCSDLGIEHWAFDLRSEFKELITEPFKEAYIRGDTPNPCTRCNTEIKFGTLLDCISRRCGSSDFMVMTGHYAKTERGASGVSLLMGADRAKDQSYFLSMLKRNVLERLLLPLGSLSKSETRKLALTSEISAKRMEQIAMKDDSMEICFMGDADYRSCIESGGRPGEIIAPDGRVLGTHSGIHRYTIGQRKGLGLTSKEPLFVVDIQAESNRVVVGSRSTAMTASVAAADINILAPEMYFDGAELTGKIRSQGAASPCVIRIGESSPLRAEFSSPLFAPAPGQYLVLYDSDRVVAGGAIIKDARSPA